MKKAIAYVLALALSLTLLAGCGSGTGKTVAESAGASTAAQTEESQAASGEAETTEAASSEASEADGTEASSAETASQEATLPAETIAPEDAVVRVGALKGPTSMGLVSMMQNNPDMYFQMETAADALTAAVIQGDLDIALVPANVAAILFNRTEYGVSVIDVNTLSVLYMVSADTSVQSVADLAGRTVYLTGKGTTPDYALQYLLSANGLSTEEVTLEYKSEATEVVSTMAQEPEAIGLLPQPFVTVATTQNENLQIVLDIGAEWEKAAENTDMPSSLVTGVTIVRNEFLAEHKDVVERFMEEHEKSAAFTNEHPAEAAQLIAQLGIVEKAAIAEKAIPYCGITYLDGQDMTMALAGYLQVLYEQNPEAVGGEIPSSEFYAAGLRQ